MSGAETAWRRVVQRRIGGAEMAAPKWPSPRFWCVKVSTQAEEFNGTIVYKTKNPASFCYFNIYMMHNTGGVSDRRLHDSLSMHRVSQKFCTSRFLQ